MKISELSQHSGVPVATIKYYLREGLLPKGEATAATQASYSQRHLQRLRLIRALSEVGALPLARIRDILDAVDDEEISLHKLFGLALYEIGPTVAVPEEDPTWDRAQRVSEELLEELGWQVTPHAPSRHRLTQALATIDRLGLSVERRVLHEYADLARAAAVRDLEWIDPEDSREHAVEFGIAMTVLLEQALLALHRLAQEDVSAQRFGPPAPHAPDDPPADTS
ncbi:MerR family transcriptional regulator [Salinactinospora qingdaonensis]|uniref:MerR family transcriptional regulator n=1 Tax=Salinactinospora qingdaonensis TaxID=702744 RepID=A0ABP7FRB1_9ACTN